MKDLKLNPKFLKLRKNSILIPLILNLFAFTFGIFFLVSLIWLFIYQNYNYSTWFLIILYFFLFVFFLTVFFTLNNKYLILANYYGLKKTTNYLKNQRNFGIFSIFNFFNKKTEIHNEFENKYLSSKIDENLIDKALIVKLFFIHKVYSYISIPFSTLVLIFAIVRIGKFEALKNLSGFEFFLYSFIIPLIVLYLTLITTQIIYFIRNKKYVSKIAYKMSFVPIVNIFAGSFI